MTTIRIKGSPAALQSFYTNQKASVVWVRTPATAPRSLVAKEQTRSVIATSLPNPIYAQRK